MTFTCKKAFVSTSIISISLVITVFFAEFVLSNIHQGDESAKEHWGVKRNIYLREHPPGTVLYRISNYPLVIEKDNGKAVTYRFGVDDNGFIEPSNVYQNADLDIVLLGGSTTETMWVKEDKRLHVTLRKYFEESGYKVNVYNAGVSGNNSLHSNLIFDAKIIPMRPDVVVLMHNINDLSVQVALGGYWNQHYNRGAIWELSFYRAINLAINRGLVKLLPNITRLGKNARQKLSQIDGVGKATDEFKSERVGDRKYDAEKHARDFVSSLRSFVIKAKSWNITPVLMTQASRIKSPIDESLLSRFQNLKPDYGIGMEEFVVAFNHYNDLIRKVASEENIILVDLAEEVPSNVEYIYDEVHMNEKGIDVAATKMQEKIQRALFEQ